MDHKYAKHDKRLSSVNVVSILQFLFTVYPPIFFVFNRFQFFITAGDRLDSLDGRYTIFGEVVDDDIGFETLEKINNAYCDEDGRPYVDIRYVEVFGNPIM